MSSLQIWIGKKVKNMDEYAWLMAFYAIFYVSFIGVVAAITTTSGNDEADAFVSSITNVFILLGVVYIQIEVALLRRDFFNVLNRVLVMMLIVLTERLVVYNWPSDSLMKLMEYDPSLFLAGFIGVYMIIASYLSSGGSASYPQVARGGYAVSIRGTSSDESEKVVNGKRLKDDES